MALNTIVVAKCFQLRANCANCKQTAPTTSHLGHRKATQFCRCIYKNKDTVKHINKGVNLYASKYQLFNILNTSPLLTQSKLIGVIMPPI